MKFIRRFARYFLLLVVLLVASCGGSGNIGVSAEGGRVKLVIHWPETREIPAATESLNFKVVTLIANDENEIVEKEQVKEQVVQRPTGQTVSTVVLEDLPSVKVRIKATAHESTDGTGAVLASGSVDITVSEAGTVNAAITLAGDVVIPAFFKAFALTLQEVNAREPIDISTDYGSANSSYGSVSCQITSLGVPFTGENTAYVRFQDILEFQAPGMAGQPLVGNAVFNVTKDGGANTEILVHIFGQVRSAGEVSIPLSELGHSFGGAPSFQLVASISRSAGDDPASVSVTFVGFEGLPAGATVRSLSGNSWADVP